MPIHPMQKYLSKVEYSTRFSNSLNPGSKSKNSNFGLIKFKTIVLTTFVLRCSCVSVDFYFPHMKYGKYFTCNFFFVNFHVSRLFITKF
jgi:hypothetical protein